jgi:hypothetical protein
MVTFVASVSLGLCCTTSMFQTLENKTRVFPNLGKNQPSLFQALEKAQGHCSKVWKKSQACGPPGGGAPF